MGDTLFRAKELVFYILGVGDEREVLIDWYLKSINGRIHENTKKYMLF